MKSQPRQTRRHFLGHSLATATLLAAPRLHAAPSAKIVVIGGGPGGATLARLLNHAGLQTTLVEPNAVYHTCFSSNLALGGLMEFADLAFTYDALRTEGVTIKPARAIGVDRAAKTVRLEGCETLAYDHLALSPGVDFINGAVPGWSMADAQIMPHAYLAGEQAALLRDQIDAMPQGGTFAMIAPPNPYRCPPAPYERVSMIAHRLTQTNPTAKILILDPKDHFSKQTLFENAWGKYYNGMVTWFGPDFGAQDVAVRPATMEVLIEGEAQRVDVCNVIPAQQAGAIAHLAGVVDETGWAPIDPFTFFSRIDPQITVLGDACAQGDMPKSAFAAHGQAFAASNAIRTRFTGTSSKPQMFSNTCWSFLAPDDAVKITESFHPTPEKITTDSTFISAPDETPQTRKATAVEGADWFSGLTQNIFE